MNHALFSAWSKEGAQKSWLLIITLIKGGGGKTFHMEEPLKKQEKRLGGNLALTLFFMIYLFLLW